MPHRRAARTLALALVLSAFVAECAARPLPSAQPVIVSPDATTSAPAEKLAIRGRTFIPLHSTLIGQGGVTRLNFSGALSIHNASSTNVLAIEKIEYRSGSGKLIENYLSEPIYLKPYASLQVIIAQDDVRGGTGASFTVDWSNAEGSDEPLIEAVMTSYTGPHSYAILSPGRRVSRPQ
ncbi:MAG: DUF3124 domain-containing protein [Methylocystis sp.]|uniref:DUF3124 domain-containing protein n=1 Tax=Methylocystis sp. TaxID=1911079 RepID=UPI003D0AFDBA